MQTNDRNEESHPRPETAAVNPAPAQAEESGAAAPASPAHAELEVPLAGQHALRRRDELSPERIESIRQRVVDGAYASEAVLDTVARRILKSRDL